MNRSSLPGILLCFALLLAPVADCEPLAKHVVLVSVDGFRPEFYLDTNWPAPTIQQMSREGSRAERVRGVFPTVTYPSHTTLVTGALPAVHGIVDNSPFEPAGETGRWYWEEKAILVDTLWDLVRDAGGKTAAVSWPVTVGARIDWMIPEVWDHLPESDDRLRPMREGTTPAGLWSEIEREATGRLNMQTYSARYIARDDKTGAAAAYLFETYRPTFMAFHAISTDHFQHEDGRDSDKVRRSLSAADSSISAVVEAAERAGVLADTAFIVTGDHGFVDVHTEVAPNVLLKTAGLTGPARNRGAWKAAFHTSGGAAFLYLNDGEGDATEREVREILDNLPANIRKLFRVVSRDEMDSVSAAPEARFALAATRGVEFTSRAEGELVTGKTGGQHGYFPTDFPEIYTGFVAWGAGIKPGVTLHEIGLEDVAPVIGELLGLPVRTAQGVAPFGILAR